jgi:hypothetical protein
MVLRRPAVASALSLFMIVVLILLAAQTRDDLDDSEPSIS